MAKSNTVEEQPRAPKARPLVRLGRQVILHVNSISLLCYTAGVVALLLLPMLAKRTYISENALMPGSGSAAFNWLDTIHARTSAEELMKLAFQEPNISRVVSNWLLGEMIALGADSYLHPYNPPDSAFSATRFPTSSGHFKWGSGNSTIGNDYDKQKISAANVVGIIRAPQAEGNEAVVLVTPYDAENFGQESALTLGMGLALFARLSQALWLARDVVWLVPDSKYGVYPAVASWLKEYHDPTTSNIPLHHDMKSDLLRNILLESGQFSIKDVEALTLGDFKRAGTIASGLVYELKSGLRQGGKDSLTLWAEGPNGEMPNLDFINVVNSIAEYRESLKLRLEIIPGLKSWQWLKFVGDCLQQISIVAKQLNPSWHFVSSGASYVTSMSTLLSSMFYQVTGLPTGAHGAFRDYQIDAITLQFTISDDGPDQLLVRIGRLLEGVLRSVNNLLEKWHQSFFLYFLSGPSGYISVGVYMIPFGLLLLSLPLQAAALCYHAEGVKYITKAAANTSSQVAGSENMPTNNEIESLGRTPKEDGPGRWLQALFLVGAVQLWAFFILLALFLISQMEATVETKLVFWLGLAAIGLLVAFIVPKFLAASTDHKAMAQAPTQNWAVVKAATLGITTIYLAVMSTVNFAVSLIGALSLVPMCLGVFPLRYTWTYAHSESKSMIGVLALAVGTIWTLIVSPLGLPLVIWTSYGHLLDLNSKNIWNLAESLLQWRSALLPHILVIHLPCSVLGLYILLSRHPT